MTKDQVAKKVKDLLTLARNTSFPEEAATAKKMATKLVEKHGLTEGDVFGEQKRQEQGVSYQKINLNEMLLNPETQRFLNELLDAVFGIKGL
jgi:hypothetical protein